VGKEGKGRKRRGREWPVVANNSNASIIVHLQMTVCNAGQDIWDYIDRVLGRAYPRVQGVAVAKRSVIFGFI
jgi:hypothetical protein